MEGVNRFRHLLRVVETKATLGLRKVLSYLKCKVLSQLIIVLSHIGKRLYACHSKGMRFMHCLELMYCKII